MSIIALSANGKKISRQAITPVVGASGDVALAVTVTDLDKVDYLLQINLNTSPTTTGIPHDLAINGNVVGITVYAGAGTTLSGEIIAIGN
jgi:hypothetical protein